MVLDRPKARGILLLDETMINYACNQCQWWDSTHPSIKLVPLKLGKQEIGFCRKHKPGGLRIELNFYGVWPVTDAKEFCGEFREG